MSRLNGNKAQYAKRLAEQRSGSIRPPARPRENADPRVTARTSIVDALARAGFKGAGTGELIRLTGLTYSQAIAQLEALVREGRATRERVTNAYRWTLTR